MQRRFRLINYVVLLIVAMLVIAAFVLIFGTKDKIIEAPGQVMPVEYDVVRAGLDGVIEAVYVSPGQTVRKGDSLFKLATPDLNLAASQAAIELKMTEVNLAKITEEYDNLMKSESFETQSDFANLYQAKRAAEIAEKRYERAESLFVKGFVSSEDRDDRLLDFELSQSYYLSLKERANLLEKRYLLQIKEQKDKVELARQKYEHATSKLGGVTAVAPITGEILTSNLDELLGRKVGLGEAVLEIGDCTQMNFIAEVAEADMPLVRPNQEARIFINAYPHRRFRTFPAAVVRISPLPRQTDGGVTYQTVLLIEDCRVNPDSSSILLKPGLLGKAEIIIERDVRILKIILDKAD